MSKRYSVEERDLIVAAMDFAHYGCIFPKGSPGHRDYQNLRAKIRDFKKELQSSDKLQKGERLKYYIDNNTDWYPEKNK